MGDALARFELDDHGLFAEHNFPCPICHRRKAVYDCNDGKFGPCWSCHKDGWRLSRTKGPRAQLFRWLGALGEITWESLTHK